LMFSTASKGVKIVASTRTIKATSEPSAVSTIALVCLGLALKRTIVSRSILTRLAATFDLLKIRASSAVVACVLRAERPVALIERFVTLTLLEGCDRETGFRD
jgi:hypothetical protein